MAQEGSQDVQKGRPARPQYERSEVEVKVERRPDVLYLILNLSLNLSLLPAGGLFQHPAKHLCATMRHDDTLVLPVTHAHRPVQPFSSSSRAAHGRFTRHDGTVL